MSGTSPLIEHYITEQEYLEGEKRSELRHEYIQGEVYAMAGSSRRHNRIAGNLYIAFSTASHNTACEVFSSDLKVRIDSRKSYYYPDVLVTYDTDDNQDEYYIDKPCLIVEVLSKSTQQKDYREKLLAYQTISSLENYLIIAQDKCHIDLFYREKQGDWWIQTFKAMEDIITLSCPQCEISLTEIYNGIKFG
jgi:Uma2 family endonuclease